MFSAAAIVLRYARIIAVCAVLGAIAVAGYTLVRPREYTVESAIMPQVRNTPIAGLSSLAAQLGVLAPGTDPSQGPAFYVELARSRELLYRLVTEPVPIADRRDSAMTLVEWYRARGHSEAERQAYAVEQLRDDIATSANARTGVVRVRVTLEDPGLAAATSERLIALLNEFNLRGRQTQAGQERQFVEERMAAVRADLGAAESRLATFLRRNLEYNSSPDLRVQYDRLSRELNIQQQLYITLAQSYEQAKIEEVRNTPVLSVVEHARVPVRPDSRFLAIKTILALLAGGLLGLVLAAFSDFLRRRRFAEPSAYEQFREERRRVLAPISRMFGSERPR